MTYENCIFQLFSPLVHSSSPSVRSFLVPPLVLLVSSNRAGTVRAVSGTTGPGENTNLDIKLRIRIRKIFGKTLSEKVIVSVHGFPKKLFGTTVIPANTEYQRRQ